MTDAELLAAIGWTDIKKREQAVKELLQAREQQLLTELLDRTLSFQVPDGMGWKQAGFNETWIKAVPVSVIERLQNKTNDGCQND